MEICGLPESGMIKASAIAKAYDITLEEAQALKTCSENMTVSEEIAARLVKAGLAKEFEDGGVL